MPVYPRCPTVRRENRLPLEGAAILLAIDQILDMARTSVNVMGNCIATAVVARWEGVFDDEKMRAFAAGKAGTNA